MLREHWPQYIAGVVVVGLIVAFVYYSNPDVRKRRDLRPPALRGGSERENRLVGEIDLEKLYPQYVLRVGKGQDKLVALTFDDGPDKLYTPQILDILRDKGVKATFFVIGNRVEEYPDVLKRIAAEGHLLGNHTYSHPLLVKDSTQAALEISRAEEVLKKHGATARGFFRPPYGAINPDLVEKVAQMGYKIALWSVDSLDWRGLSKAEVVKNIENFVAPGSVILQHSAGGPGEDLSGSVSALPEVIDRLRQKGYRFVTLLEMFPPKDP